MWPWEHAAVGYIAYSLLARAFGRNPPGDAAAIAVIVGTQVPDLVDKPLAWWLGVLPAGRSLAHSLLFAVPVVLTGLVLTGWAGRKDVGVAFGVGYLLHLPGDVVYPILLGSEPAVGFLLYPLVPAESYATTGVVARVGNLAADFLTFLETPRGRQYLYAELALLLSTVALWAGDGWPGPGLFRRQVRRALPV